MAHKKPLKRPYRLSTQVIACSLSSPPRLPTSDVFFCRPEVYSFTHVQYLNGYSASDYIYSLYEFWRISEFPRKIHLQNFSVLYGHCPKTSDFCDVFKLI